MKFDQLSTGQIKALAAAHVRLYEHRLTAGSGHVNHAECERYLGIWKRILVKAINLSQWRLMLSEAERREIQDAIECGDYAELLRGAAEPPS
jgi:hypothetical protein